MFITLDQLRLAYEQIGFTPLPGEPYAFEAGCEVMFHSPFEGTVAIDHVVEDVACWDKGRAKRLAQAIQNIVDEEDAE